MMGEREKIAVVLMNLGGPSDEESIRPYLFNFFMDKNIIAAPLPLRWLLAKWISWKRGKGAAYESYRHLGFVSPLLAHTRAQAQALEDRLSCDDASEVRCFVVMRYWHPRAAATAKDVKDFNPDRIILLPLYPQYSTATVRSSFQDWEKACRQVGLAAATEKICCYPRNEGFVKASARRIEEALANAPPGIRVLFSAHGLPEKTIRAGDPYQWQCEETARHIVAAIGREDLDWQICYQSRVGPLTWIGPSTEEALSKAAADGVGVLVYPHAFVSEHVETLVEIDIEYRALAEKKGIPWFGKVETVGTDPLFIEGLAEEVFSRRQNRLCPAIWRQCPFHAQKEN